MEKINAFKPIHTPYTAVKALKIRALTVQIRIVFFLFIFFFYNRVIFRLKKCIECKAAAQY